MEQHNIDSHFNQGLENLNRQPSTDAWARLQQRMQEAEAAPVAEKVQPEEKEERRVIAWWYYAAAALVLLLLSVGVLQNSKVTGPENMPVAEIKPAKVKNVEETPVNPETENAAPALAANTEGQPTENTLQEKVTSESKTNAPAAFKPENSIALTTKGTRKKKPAIIVLPHTKNTAVAPQETVPTEEKTLLASVTESPVKAQAKAEQSKSLEGTAIEVIVKRDRPATENAIAMETVSETDEKGSKLKNIFKQARNLKNGDGVNLQELGLTADSKLAMGTRNIQQKFSKVLDI